MIEFLQTFLPLVIYVLLIVLLIVGIILGIRLIHTLDKVDRVVDDVNDKVRTLDGLFNVVDIVSDKVSLVTNKVVDGIGGLFGRFKKGSDYEDEYEEEDE